jgi:hypothetical protein
MGCLQDDNGSELAAKGAPHDVHTYSSLNDYSGLCQPGTANAFQLCKLSTAEEDAGDAHLPTLNVCRLPLSQAPNFY